MYVYIVAVFMRGNIEFLSALFLSIVIVKRYLNLIKVMRIKDEVRLGS